MTMSDWVGETLKKATPRCAEAINTILDPFRGIAGYMATTAAKGEARTGRGFVQAAWGGDGKGLTDFTIGEGKDAITLNGGKMAATGVGLGLGYRALSGGGVYRDKNGNTDIAGIPFV